MAKSNYYKSPVHQSFITWVKDQNEKGASEANLSELPGIEAESDSSLHVVSLLSSFAHNTFFESFVIHDVPRKDLFSPIATMLRRNNTITKFVCTNLGGSNKIGEFGQALAQNKQHQISIFDVSYNNIGGGDFFQLVDAFDAYPHGLTVLNLSNCFLSQKAIVELFGAFQRNFGMSLTIEELILDNNSFGFKGTEAFASWLSKTKDLTPLRKLSIASCNLSLELLFLHFGFKQLQFLNLSEASVSEKTGLNDFLTFLRSTGTLQELRLSKCGLYGDVIGSIFNALLGNQNLAHLSINVSKNKIGSGKKQCDTFKNTLKTFSNTVTFDSINLCDNVWKSVDLNDVIQALVSNNYAIKKLSVGDRGHVYKHKFPIEQSIDALFAGKYIQRFSIKGKYNNFNKLMELLGNNNNILHADLSEMLFEDSGAIALAEVIRKNRTLRSLKIDGNNIGLNGYISLRDALEKNNTLWYLEFPKNDFQRLEASFKSNERKQRLHKIFFMMQNYIERNQKVGGGYSPEMFEPAKHDSYINALCLPVKPLADVPEHLKNLAAPEKGQFVEEADQQGAIVTPGNTFSPGTSIEAPTSPRRSVRVNSVQNSLGAPPEDTPLPPSTEINTTGIASLLLDIDKNYDVEGYEYEQQGEYEASLYPSTTSQNYSNNLYPPSQTQAPPVPSFTNPTPSRPPPGPPPTVNKPPPPVPPFTKASPPPPPSDPPSGAPPPPPSFGGAPPPSGGPPPPPPGPPPAESISTSEIKQRSKESGRGGLLADIQKGSSSLSF